MTSMVVQGPDVFKTQKMICNFLTVVSGVDCDTAVRHTIYQYGTTVKPGRPAGKNLITSDMYRLVTFMCVFKLDWTGDKVT